MDIVNAREEALRKLLRLATASLVQTTYTFHRLVRDGMPVDVHRPDGSIAGDHVRLVDFATAPAIDWLVVNQFSVSEGLQAHIGSITANQEWFKV